MRLGLISDTHLRDPGADLGPEIASLFAGVDLIVHAGDVYVPGVLDWLGRLAPVVCAEGNGDCLLRGDIRVRPAHVLVLEGMTVGVTHGLDYPEPEWRPLERAMSHEFGGPVDVLVFGDSHVPVVERCRGVLLVNPGSPTLPRGLVGVAGTVGLLELRSGRAEARIAQLRANPAKLA